MKISALAIIFSGGCIAVAVLSVGYIFFMGPNIKEAKMLDENTTSLEEAAAKKPQATKRSALAVQMVEQAREKWRGVVATNTPPPTLAQGGVDLGVNGYQLIIDTRKYQDSLQTEINTQLKKGGVIVTGPYVPRTTEAEPANSVLASFYNYPAIKYPVVILDLGTVTVQGTYEQISANVRAWSSMPRYLAVADGLAISGTSPNLTGTYNLSVVGFIRGKDIYPSVSEAVTSANGQGGGAGGRGGAGGAPPGAPLGAPSNAAAGRMIGANGPPPLASGNAGGGK